MREAFRLKISKLLVNIVNQPLFPYQTYFKSYLYCRSLTTLHGKLSKAIEVDPTILTKSFENFNQNASLIPRYVSESIGSVRKSCQRYILDVKVEYFQVFFTSTAQE